MSMNMFASGATMSINFAILIGCEAKMCIFFLEKSTITPKMQNVAPNLNFSCMVFSHGVIANLAT